MKVILLDNIRGVGQVGDIKQVSDGYARNFLLPRNLARPASTGAVKDIQAFKAKKLAELSLSAENARTAADKLKDVSLEFTAKASEKGTLFEGIGPEAIVQKLKEATSVSLPVNTVKLPEHIKTTGEHVVILELAPEVSVTLKVVVKAE